MNAFILKAISRLLLLIGTVSAWGQHVHAVECDNVGDTAWPSYAQYREDLAQGKRFPTIREMDANLYPVHEWKGPINYVFNQVYLRWLLIDETIPYVLRITDIMDRELIRQPVSSCAVKIIPDSLMREFNTDVLIVHIERADRDGLDVGLLYLFQKPDETVRQEVFAQLEKCETMNDQINYLMSTERHHDVLSLIEAASENNHPAKEALGKRYWKIVSLINQR